MEVLSETRNHIAFITLNRPSALNALSLGMIEELRTWLHRHAADPDIYAVLLRFFSYGYHSRGRQRFVDPRFD